MLNQSSAAALESALDSLTQAILELTERLRQTVESAVRGGPVDASTVRDLGDAVIHVGDCLDVLKKLADNSIDSVVTDPPYGLSFMGKKWDYDVPSEAVWRECLRVLKPGGHLLAFAGTRTQHRMAVRIEDAGFEIRDMIAWVYGTGFPKSYNGEWGGTALKPALEPVTMARKPLEGRVEDNWREHGTGALNIDKCRVGDKVETWPATRARPAEGQPNALYTHKLAGNELTQTVTAGAAPPGRWPANLIYDGSEEVVTLFPDSNGSGSARTLKRGKRDGEGWGMADEPGELRDAGSGSSARFFYCAKASKADRGEGNNHPTVKPTELMRYLCRLVTPRGGVVLDPFTGSGSTGKAARLEGFKFIGIERDESYAEIATARVAQNASAQPA